MRVVMVVKPAGMPSTAGTPKEVTLSTKAMALAPAMTGRSSGRVTLRKASSGSGARGTSRALQVGLGAGVAARPRR